MKYAVFNDRGGIELREGSEIDTPAGATKLNDSQFSQLLSGAFTILEDGSITEIQKGPPTIDELQQVFTAAIQQRLDDFARSRNYDNILSACTYVTSAVPKFKAEGQACVNLRDATWAAAYDILTKVQAGKRPMPSSIVDIEADLPAAVWPA